MRKIVFALCLACAPLAACASHMVEHKQVSRAEERQALAAAEEAYAEAWKAYNGSHGQNAEARWKAYNALAVAHTALEATRNAFETDGAPTFMDTAVNAKRLADEAKAAAVS